MPRPGRPRLGCWLAIAILSIVAVVAWRELKRLERDRPELLPWTELSLSDPIGPFTGAKLVGLTDERTRCLALLDGARLAEAPVPARIASPVQCQFNDGVTIRPEGEQSTAYSPAGLVTSCPVAAALFLWERDVVQPAAEQHFDSRVTRIDHAGSFSCRRLYGQSEGRFSEHATADAVDLTSFHLEDGRRISVLGGWRGQGPDSRFLRALRDGACDLFSTVLSPDYNQAHADHFHFDLASRGAAGRSLCR